MSEFKKAMLSRKTGAAELVALLLYIAGISVTTAFHEPCFDEAQAWMIARSASWKDIFTYVPHYEGHPPLWHSLLAIFAKAGAPYPITLKIVGVVIASAAAAYLLFRSPFPKAIRCTLPFTYFLFYQYGVLARPYSLMALAMFMAADGYTKRNEKPWRYILPLCLLSLTSMFGLMFACCLCVVWTFETAADILKAKKARSFYRDPRFVPLCAIFVLGVVTMICIFPASDVYNGALGKNAHLLSSLQYHGNYIRFALAPFECWSGTIECYGNEYCSSVEITSFVALIEAAAGVLMWIVLIAYAVKNKSFWTFFLPFFTFTYFRSFIYCSIHHTGIGTIFHIFFFWTLAARPEGVKIPEFLLKFAGLIKNASIRRICAGGLCALYLATIGFSAAASVNDIRNKYYFTDIADFIKKYDLDERKIMLSWSTEYDIGDDEGDMSITFAQFAMPSRHNKVVGNNVYIIGIAPVLLPYFDENIFMNFNVDRPGDLYMFYGYAEDDKAVMEKWREQGLPDVIIDYLPLDEVYSAKELENVRYVVVYESNYNTAFKIHGTQDRIFVYMREDLLPEYPDLKPLYDPRIAGEYEPPTEASSD